MRGSPVVDNKGERVFQPQLDDLSPGSHPGHCCGARQHPGTLRRERRPSTWADRLWLMSARRCEQSVVELRPYYGDAGRKLLWSSQESLIA